MPSIVGWGVLGEFTVTMLVAVVASVVVFLGASWIPQAKSFASLRATVNPGIANFSVLRIGDKILLGMWLAYIAVFSSLAILKHQSFNTGFDVALFNQVLWNSLRGHLFENSILVLGSSYLGNHFAPVLLALVPFYAIWQDPPILLMLQTVAIATAVLPLYWFARARLGNLLALTIALAFFLSPALEYVNLYEFHETPFAMSLLMFGIFFLLRDRIVPFVVCLGVALLIREEIGFAAITFGVYVFFHGRPRFGLALIMVGLLWLIVMLQYVIPFFAERMNYFYASALYSSFGNSPSQVLLSILTQPELVARTILTPPRIEFVLHFMVPLAFLPLLGAEIAALSLPYFSYLLLSSRGYEYMISTHYPALIIPFIYFGTVAGLERVLKQAPVGDRRALRWGLATLVIVPSFLSYYLQGPGPLAQHFDGRLYLPSAKRVAAFEVLAQKIPADASVLAASGIFPHLSQRRVICEFPYIPDYRQVEYVLIRAPEYWNQVEQPSRDYLSQPGYFEMVARANEYVLWKRKPSEHLLRIKFGGQMSLLGYTLVTTDTLRGGLNLSPIFEWRTEPMTSSDVTVHVSLVDNAGHVWAQEKRIVQNGMISTCGTEDGVWRDEFTLRLPSFMPAGAYQITLSINDPGIGGYVAARDGSDQPLGNEPVVATVHVEKDHSSILASQLPMEQPLYVDMGEIRFIGYVPLPTTIRAGELLSVGMYWRARAKPQGDYAVMVQLRDVNGRVVFEHTDRPAKGTYPTTEWNAGEVLLDWHDFTLPSNLTPGAYEIWVALRDSASRVLIGELGVSPLKVVE